MAANNNPSRELILNRIRAGLQVTVSVPHLEEPARPFFAPIDNPLERFQQECKANLMELALTSDAAASANQLASILDTLPAGEIFVQDHAALRSLVQEAGVTREMRWSSQGGPREVSQATISLAEALVARDTAAQDHARVVRQQAADEQAAYRHARFHRVSELIDLGYGLDQAVAIANANEAEVRARAAATGRNPIEPIYQYAVLNGYRPLRSDRPSPHGGGPAPQRAGGEGSILKALSDLGEAAFAEATKGDRWEALMR